MTAIQQRLFDASGYRQAVARMTRPGRWSMHATAARAALVYVLSPSFGSFAGYIAAIWSRDQMTNDTTDQIAEALQCEPRTVKRHLATGTALGLWETRSVRIAGRQRRVLVPGPRFCECDELAPPERRVGVTDPVTPTVTDPGGLGDRSSHPEVTDPVTLHRGREPKREREAPSPRSHTPGECKTCGAPTDSDDDGRPWPYCRDCTFGEASERPDDEIMDAVWGPALNT